MSPPHKALIERPIIGPDRQWGSFVFTPLSGLVQDIPYPPTTVDVDAHVDKSPMPTDSLPHDYTESSIPRDGFDCIPPWVTPERDAHDNRTLVFPPSQEIDTCDLDPVPTSILRHVPSPHCQWNTFLTEPPTITRLHTHKSQPLRVDFHPDTCDDKLTVLIQAVDYIKLPETKDLGKEEDASKNESTITLRKKRSRRLNPYWE
jgi:hypothetical protein